MNRDFLKAALLVFLVIIAIGIIALAVPGYDNNYLKIKPLKWFGWLWSKPDSTNTSPPDSIWQQTSLLADNSKPLKSLVKKLENLRSTNNMIRIAYFGDSIIEGDLITQQLRYNLQSSYGGSGVGFMPITSNVAGFRRTIRHSFAKNWETLSFMTPYRAEYPIGISGFVFIPRNYYTLQKTIETEIDSLADSLSVNPSPAPSEEMQKFYVDTNPWVQYKYADVRGGTKQFERIRLFYSHSRPGSEIAVSYDSQPSQKRFLPDGEGLQTLDLSAGTPVRDISLEFPFSNPAHLYGMSFDQPGGVFVDNFAIRGFSGMYFQRILKSLLQQFQSELQYDLIVLQYGENVSNPKTTSYDYYKTGMIKTIRYLQSAFPGVPILLISAHDRSIKTAKGFQTSPDIPILIKAQAEIADSTGCAFWNLYEAMGGKDSMQKYVKNVPPLASSDYTHFNQNGANLIADMLTDFLLTRKKK